MTEFTGERVIPGSVDADLWNEHLARYAFASRFAFGKRVLDVGCGAGYGSALLAASAASVVGIDVAGEAVAYARANYARPNVRFTQASGSALPLRSEQTDLIIAFEVIEHVAAWREFLKESRRLLSPRGMFLVSTPNIHYYAETRRQSGPNRFHEHEFEYEEFVAELQAVFPHLAMYLQNHSDSLVFQPVETTLTAEARLASSAAEPSEAHFFVALCALEPLPPVPAFVFLPSTANVLRERELHIEKLQGELSTKDQWLREAADQHTALLGEHRKLHELYRELEGHLEAANRWAQQLEGDLKSAGDRVFALQGELSDAQEKAVRTVQAYEAKVAELERENEEKTNWAQSVERRLGSELSAKCDELARCVEILHSVEAERDERSLHAASVESKLTEIGSRLDAAQSRIEMARSSRWVRLGRVVGIGPDLESGDRSLMRNLARFVRAIPLLLLSPILVLVPLLSIAVADLLWALIGRRRPFQAPSGWARPAAASIVIPNWNGRNLLARYLPSVVEAARAVPGSEVIVVDNGSTDGSADFVRSSFPQVRLLDLPRNLGFGGGSNTGFRAARNPIVVLLNSDMRVEPGFLQPLLDAFTDSSVFAVSCQIFLSDPKKRREETGLTQAWWANGGLRVRHREDGGIKEPYPCFYGGGGSCAFDRAKFLELGGFDEILAPFYLEDTDLGYLAWKRGWKVLYQPASVVWHEHRGTIGKRFTPAYIEAVLKKNFILFCWKNIHEWRKLIAHFSHSWAGAALSVFIGDSPERSNLSGILRAFLHLPAALGSRWRARALAAVDDTEAFLRPLGGYFRDRFEPLPQSPDRLGVLFLSPYPICPPIHGGGVFMYQTLRELGRRADVHVIALLDFEHERQAHAMLVPSCRSMEFLVRMEGKSAIFASMLPHAVLEFSNSDLEWLIHRQIYTQRVDLFQIEYTNMAQYACRFSRIPCLLFEHDVYFQSIGRILHNLPGLLRRVSASLEYLRALRYELRELHRLDGIEVCTAANRDFLVSFAPSLGGKTWEGLRAGIDTTTYEFRTEPREPDTLLFLGSFRHLPNQEALDWFTRQVLPLILERRPSARLIVIGSDPPPRYSLPEDTPNIEIRGFVEDVREPLGRYAVFVCPILSGSGVRVKLLEAFAAGIPAVSTRIGAEGLASVDGNICRLADDPAGFAERVLGILDRPVEAAAMAVRARSEVERNWDMAVITGRLYDRYRQVVRQKREAAPMIS